MSSASANITSTPSNVDNDVLLDKIVDLRSRHHYGLPPTSGPGHTYTYNFGFRKTGDTLIDFRRDNEKYAAPQDVKLLVKCRAEPGQYITQASIEVKQSSDKRDDRIIDGGIGEDHITILIEAGKTYWFNYEVRIFGGKIMRETILEKVNLEKDITQQ